MPPGAVTRSISASAFFGSLTLRRPNEIVTASNSPSANGSAIASASTKVTLGVSVPTAALGDHARREVAGHHLGAAARQGDRARAGAGGEIEDALAGPRSDGTRRGDAPQPVLPRLSTVLVRS
jgi:hypothetical protein